jgi:RNA 3'-terminal phosphate cyclase (ATP)
VNSFYGFPKVLLPDNEVKGHLRGAEGTHLNVDALLCNCRKALCRNPLASENPGAHNAYQRHIRHFDELPVGSWLHTPDGLTPSVEILATEEKADAGLGSHHGLDVDSAFRESPGDESQNAGSCTHAGSMHFEDSDIGVMGDALDRAAGPGDLEGDPTPRGIRFHGVFDGNIEPCLPQRLHGAGMKDLGAEVGKFRCFIIGEEWNEPGRGNKMRIRTHVSGHILPYFKDFCAQRRCDHRCRVVASAPSERGDVPLITDAEESRHENYHALLQQRIEMDVEVPGALSDIGGGVAESAVRDKSDLVGHAMGGRKAACTKSGCKQISGKALAEAADHILHLGRDFPGEIEAVVEALELVKMVVQVSRVPLVVLTLGHDVSCYKNVFVPEKADDRGYGGFLCECMRHAFKERVRDSPKSGDHDDVPKTSLCNQIKNLLNVFLSPQRAAPDFDDLHPVSLLPERKHFFQPTISKEAPRRKTQQSFFSNLPEFELDALDSLGVRSYKTRARSGTTIEAVVKEMGMIEIDGSRKSGSGTIVRDAIPFAVLVGREIRVFNIRSKRDKPGLRPQHLKAMEAAAMICGGRLLGGVVGAEEIRFQPGGAPKGGRFMWNIGTAGSTALLCLSVLPLGLFADQPSVYRVVGGLFQDFAPSLFHLQHVLLPLLRTMGIRMEVKIVRPGYVPRGGGEIEVKVFPMRRPLQPLELVTPGSVTGVRGIALSSGLEKRNVSERMAKACKTVLKMRGHHAEIEVIYDESENPAFESPSLQAGAALAVWATTEKGCRIGSDMAGARSRTAERIGSETARMLVEDLDSGATLDRHLADQVIPFSALAEGRSVFVVPKMTEHVEARLWLAEKILHAGTEVRGNRITIHGTGYRI